MVGEDVVVKPSALRPWARRAMVAGLAVLVFTLVMRTTADAPKATIDATPVATPSASSPARPTPTPNASAVSSPDDSLTLVRLWSPGPNRARIEATTSSVEVTVVVQIDGRPESPITVRSNDGGFVVDVADLEPGPREICLNDACRRVLVAAPVGASQPSDAELEEFCRTVPASTPNDC